MRPSPRPAPSPAGRRSTFPRKPHRPAELAFNLPDKLTATYIERFIFEFFDIQFFPNHTHLTGLNLRFRLPAFRFADLILKFVNLMFINSQATMGQKTKIMFLLFTALFKHKTSVLTSVLTSVFYF